MSSCALPAFLLSALSVNAALSPLSGIAMPGNGVDEGCQWPRSTLLMRHTAPKLTYRSDRPRPKRAEPAHQANSSWCAGVARPGSLQSDPSAEPRHARYPKRRWRHRLRRRDTSRVRVHCPSRYSISHKYSERPATRSPMASAMTPAAGLETFGLSAKTSMSVVARPLLESWGTNG